MILFPLIGFLSCWTSSSSSFYSDISSDTLQSRSFTLLFFFFALLSEVFFIPIRSFDCSEWERTADSEVIDDLDSESRSCWPTVAIVVLFSRGVCQTCRSRWFHFIRYILTFFSFAPFLVSTRVTKHSWMKFDRRHRHCAGRVSLFLSRRGGGKIACAQKITDKHAPTHFSVSGFFFQKKSSGIGTRLFLVEVFLVFLCFPTNRTQTRRGEGEIELPVCVEQTWISDRDLWSICMEEGNEMKCIRRADFLVRQPVSQGASLCLGVRV